MKIIFIILVVVTFSYANERKNNENLKVLVKKLEKVVKLQDILIKHKQDVIENSDIDENTGRSNSEFLSCDESDIFPNLMMKEEYKTKSSNTANVTDTMKSSEVMEFAPTTYYLKVNSIIYDSINGKKIDQWKKGTLFTSYIKTKSWILVTGYFANNKWKQSQKKMWIKIAQVSEK